MPPSACECLGAVRCPSATPQRGGVPWGGVVLDLVRRGGRDEEGHRAKGSSPTGPTVHGAVQLGGRPVAQPTPSAASASVSSPDLLSISSAILESMVCAAMIRHAVTGSAWPIRWIRSMAWVCSASVQDLSLIHIYEPTRLGMISYAVFCLKKKTTIISRLTVRVHTRSMTSKEMSKPP